MGDSGCRLVGCSLQDKPSFPWQGILATCLSSGRDSPFRELAIIQPRWTGQALP